MGVYCCWVCCVVWMPSEGNSCAEHSRSVCGSYVILRGHVCDVEGGCVVLCKAFGVRSECRVCDCNVIRGCVGNNEYALLLKH